MVENPLTFDFSKTRAICDAFDSEQRQKWGNMAEFNRRRRRRGPARCLEAVRRRAIPMDAQKRGRRAYWWRNEFRRSLKRFVED